MAGIKKLGLSHLEGVPREVVKNVYNLFDTVEDLVSDDGIELFRSLDGVNPSIAMKVLDHANDYLVEKRALEQKDQMKQVSKASVPKNTDPRQHVSVKAKQVIDSEDDIFFLSEEEREKHENQAPKDNRIYVLYEHKVDDYCVVRKRVEKTPAVCDHCGWDCININGLQPWEMLSDAVQDKILRTLKKHIEIVHTVPTHQVAKLSELRKHSSLIL